MMAVLQRKVQQGVGFIIVDSAALACGGNPKDEERAIEYFNALSKLGVPSLTVAHMTKDERDDQHPFGSIFWHLSARMTWNVKSSSEPEQNPKHIGLFNRKSNEDMRHKPVGICMDFSQDGVLVERETLSDEFFEALTLQQRIREILRPGARSVKDMSEALGQKEDTVSRTLRRMSGLIRLGRSDDNSHLWGLTGD